MEFLASDALRGRGSGSADELVAATYVAAQLRAYGIAPAGDDGGYIQRATLQQPKFTGPPQLTFAKPGAAAEKIIWNYGQEFVTLRLSETHFSGPLHVVNVDEDDPQASGAVVLILGNDRRRQRAKASSLGEKGAVAVIRTASGESAAQFQQRAKELPTLPVKVEGEDDSGLLPDFNVLEVSPEAVKVLESLPANATLSFDGPTTSEKKYTWNAVGILRSSNPSSRPTAVLLSAHLDHLGIGKPVDGDDIYNGADDDASGTTAVLELARVLGNGPKPQRTVIFALFGSEETGGQGSTFFRKHPPVPLKDIAVNLEFEMLGRADPAVGSDTVWLTGWERSNLGPMLAARGAKLVKDPHPEQNFFARSDNYVLAEKGVVAQTVSSYGLHRDYHQPSDDVAHIDFKHMDAAIGSILQPVQWLVNSSFTPQWNQGGKP
jgi:aminopeptidase YwaD